MHVEWQALVLEVVPGVPEVAGSSRHLYRLLRARIPVAIGMRLRRELGKWRLKPATPCGAAAAGTGARVPGFVVARQIVRRMRRYLPDLTDPAGRMASWRREPESVQVLSEPGQSTPWVLSCHESHIARRSAMPVRNSAASA